MMKNTPNLYDTVVHILGQHSHWLDKRHFYTLAWMIVSLIESQTIGLTAWTPFVDSRATYAQSTVRRFRRWLDNNRLEVHSLYGPIIQEALTEWGQNVLYPINRAFSEVSVVNSEIPRGKRSKRRNIKHVRMLSLSYSELRFLP